MRINLGDKVKVVESGRLYSAYETAAKTMGLKKWKCYYNNLSYDTTYLVLNDFMHLRNGNKRLLGITDGEHDYVIGEEGVEVTEPGTIEGSPPVEAIIKVEYFDINNLSI